MKSKRVSLSKIVTVSGCAALLALALADGQRLLRAQLVLGQPSQSTGVSYSGQATVVSLTDIHNFSSPIVICDTGPLPSSGGTLQATVLAMFFGADEISFTTTSEDLPGVSRSFDSFSQAAEEAGLSRIYGGIHFMSANEYGLLCGAEVGSLAVEHFLLPKPGKSHRGH